MNENNFIHCHKLCRNVKVHRNVDRDPVLEVLLFFPLVSRLISFLFTFWHLKVKWKFSISIFCIGTAPFLILSLSQILRRPVMSPIILNFLEYFDGNNPRLSCILERKPHENKYRTFEEKNIHFRNAKLNPKISLQKICKGFYLFLRLSIKMCNFWSIMSVAFVRSLNYRRHICFRFFGTRIVSSLIARIANSTYSCGPLNVLCQITCTGNPEMCTVKI